MLIGLNLVNNFKFILLLIKRWDQKLLPLDFKQAQELKSMT